MIAWNLECLRSLAVSEILSIGLRAAEQESIESMENLTWVATKEAE